MDSNYVVRLVIIALSTALVGSLAVLSYFYYITLTPHIMISDREPRGLPMPGPSEFISLIDIPLDTSSWNISSYADVQKYTFRYPPEWTEVEYAPGRFMYKPVITEDYALIVGTPIVADVTAEKLIANLEHTAFTTVLSKKSFIHNNIKFFEIQATYADSYTRYKQTLFLAEDIPSVQNNPPGVVVFSTTFESTLDEDPYYNELISILSTMEMLSI